MKYNDKGEELPDPTPVAIPIGFGRPESLADMVRRLVRSERLAAGARAAGFETADEADDFDCGDDDELRSPYELTADQELALLQGGNSAGAQPAPKAEPAKPASPEAPKGPEASTSG